MSFFIVLTGADIRPSHLARLEAFLDDCHIRFSVSPRWLDPHRAAEIRVGDKPLPEQWRALKELLGPDRIDCFVTAAAGRRKKLMIADMDATIVTGETLDDLAHRAGIGEAIAAITAKAMRGEVDFESALRERVGYLKDLHHSVLQDTLDTAALSQGAKTLVRVMKAQGATCVLISGGFTFFTKVIADRAGFHFNHGNALEIIDQTLTGSVTGPILGKEAKLAYLQEYAEKMGITENDVFAIGDGANDLPMLEAAGLGVGYYPKPLLLDRLDNTILYSDLTAPLYIQGFERKDIDTSITETPSRRMH